MSSFVVDGLRLPIALAGHPALDFCNTRAGWGTPAPKEYLRTYRHLALWAREAGMLTPAAARRLGRQAAAAPDAAQAVLDRALELREAAYTLALGTRSADALALAETRARAARTAATMRFADAGSGPTAAWSLPTVGLDAPLTAVAAALDDLLCSPLSGAVGVCAGAGCGWLFADPRGRRRWCDMAVCGNRAKARRYAARAGALSRPR